MICSTFELVTDGAEWAGVSANYEFFSIGYQEGEKEGKEEERGEKEKKKRGEREKEEKEKGKGEKRRKKEKKGRKKGRKRGGCGCAVQVVME